MLLPLARELGIAVIRGRHLFQDAFQTLPHRNHSLFVRFRYIPIRSFDPFVAVVSGIIKATAAVDEAGSAATDHAKNESGSIRKRWWKTRQKSEN
jgi:hypothetical protein